MNTEDLRFSLSELLREVRIQRHMSQSDVARYLCLNEMIVARIENSIDDEMRNNVFYRGYIRSYGKLLNIPEEDINRYLNVTQHSEPSAVIITEASVESLVSPTKSQYQKSEQINFLSLKNVTLAVVGVLAVVGILWISGLFSSHSTPEIVLNTEEQTQQYINEYEEDETDGMISSEVSDSTSGRDSNPITEEFTHDDGDALGDFIKKTIPDTTLQNEANTIKKTTKISDQTNTITSPHVIVMNFNNESWIKVVDKITRNVLFAGLKSAGQSLLFDDTIQYEITIGNVSSVKLSFNGQQIDLNSHIRRGQTAFLQLDGRQ